MTSELSFLAWEETEPQPDDLPMAFFQGFLDDVKYIMNFITEFHAKGILPKDLGASFIALSSKKAGSEGIKGLTSDQLVWKYRQDCS